MKIEAIIEALKDLGYLPLNFEINYKCFNNEYINMTEHNKCNKFFMARIIEKWKIKK